MNAFAIILIAAWASVFFVALTGGSQKTWSFKSLGLVIFATSLVLAFGTLV